MKIGAAICLLALSSTVHAKEPTSLGGGQYMLTDQNFTIFGSTDKIVAKLIAQAHQFCHKKTGYEAILSDSRGTGAVVGQAGLIARPAQGATGTIHFTCGQATQVSAPIENRQPDIYTQLPKLKALLDSGAITQDEYDAQKAKLLSD
nr:SHOCT domain-containing protein [Lysobacter sp. A03]